MLKRLRIDNFKCLDGFELELTGHALLMGLNGSGKSTVVEVLDRLGRFFVGGEKAGACFPGSTRTQWKVDSRKQTFDLQFEAFGRLIDVSLTVDQREQDGQIIVAQESVTSPGFVLDRNETQVRISFEQQKFNSLVMHDRSAVPLLDNTELRLLVNSGEILQAVSSILSYRLDPASMSALQSADTGLQFDGRNFVGWLLWMKNHPQHRRRVEAIERRIAEILPTFQGFEFEPEGDRFRLFTRWCRPNQALHPMQRHDFSALSDGQRLIIALAAIVEVALLRDADPRYATTLVLDEPDNYVALQEIQLFFLSLMDAPRVQLIVVSHHPEVIDLMAKDHGYVFSREDDLGCVTVKRWRAPAGTMLTPSALVARGDIDGGA